MADQLSGRRRAAAYLKGLSPEDAADVLAHMSPAERSDLARELDALDLSREECLALTQPRWFEAIADWPAEGLASVIQMQHPQLGATIVRELPAAVQDAVLSALLPAYRRELTNRLAATTRPCGEILRTLDDAVRALVQ